MVKVNIIGLKELEAKIKKSPEKLRNDLSIKIDSAAQQIRTNAIKDAPSDTSGLRRQITVNDIGVLTKEIVSGASYSAYMEFGTKGNFTPIAGIDASEYQGKGTGDYYDFLNNILNWVKRKGIGGSYRGSIEKLSKKKQDTLVETAEAIAWSILRKGVKPHPYFFKQLLPAKKKLEDDVNELLKNLFE